MFTDREIEYLEHEEYIAKHSKHKISISVTFHAVYALYAEDGNSRYFWFYFRDKKDLIETLKEYRNFKADGRTSYSLIEERYNEGV